MKIGVLSDTHLSKVTDHFRRTLETVFRDVEMILHAGDMTSLQVYEYLCNWEVRAVRGNMDDYDLRSVLPERRTEDVLGTRIGIVHGRGSPFGIENLVLREFDNVDIIVFGHSHIPLLAKKGRVHLFNPGTFRGVHGGRATVGVIEISDGTTFNHIEVE
jgi:putative phosphoesterase